MVTWANIQFKTISLLSGVWWGPNIAHTTVKLSIYDCLFFNVYTILLLETSYFKKFIFMSKIYNQKNSLQLLSKSSVFISSLPKLLAFSFDNSMTFTIAISLNFPVYETIFSSISFLSSFSNGFIFLAWWM